MFVENVSSSMCKVM